VICGGGLHGCAAAFFLSKMGHKNLTVVEAKEVAAGASGKVSSRASCVLLISAESSCDYGARVHVVAQPLTHTRGSLLVIGVTPPRTSSIASPLLSTLSWQKSSR